MNRAQFQDDLVKQDIANFNARRKAAPEIQGLRNPLKMKGDQQVQ